MNKILKVTLPILAVAIIGGIIISIPQEEELKPKIERQAQTTVIEKVQPVEATPDVKQEPIITQEVETIQEVQTVEVIAVKSSQEYAEQYLNLTVDNQKCFDIITQEDIPYRFVESVREQNIKKLALSWPAPCSSTLIFRESNGVITRHFSFFNPNEAYFDN